MRQKKLLNQLYRACVAHDNEKIAELRQKEFRKILKRKLQGRPFTTRWTVVAV
jgi:hypothetical protein